MASSLSLALLLALTSQATAPPSDPRARAIAPFVGDEVLVVGHLDLSRLHIEALARRVLPAFPDVEEFAGPLDRWVDFLRKAGAKELFLLVDPADFPGPPVAVVPLEGAANPEAIGRVLCGGGPEKPLYAWPTCATVHHAVFAGTSAALDRVRHTRTEARPGLDAAFTASGDAVARLVVLPSNNQRRVFEEIMPTLPRELGGGSVTTITRGLRWVSVAFESEPGANVHTIIQAQDAGAAKAIDMLGHDVRGLITQAVQRRPASTDLVRDLGRIKAEVVDDRVVLNANLEQTSSLVAVPLNAALESSRRARCVNNLKQIGLAMHNYHSVKDAFPTAYSRDKEGRPLLSWRVHILPYLEQQSLYEEFHLDEPWDSPHNKELIARIPSVYVCPSASRSLKKAGKTVYLTPRGKGTIFPGGDAPAVPIKDVKDGTSNTIFVFEVNDPRAVVWTRPDDWEVDPEITIDGLFGHHLGGTDVLFADGSVRFLKESIRPELLRKLVTRNGGEIVSSDEY